MKFGFLGSAESSPEQYLCANVANGVGDGCLTIERRFVDCASSKRVRDQFMRTHIYGTLGRPFFFLDGPTCLSEWQVAMVLTGIRTVWVVFVNSWEAAGFFVPNIW